MPTSWTDRTEPTTAWTDRTEPSITTSSISSVTPIGLLLALTKATTSSTTVSSPIWTDRTEPTTAWTDRTEP